MIAIKMRDFGHAFFLSETFSCILTWLVVYFLLEYYDIKEVLLWIIKHLLIFCFPM